MSVTPVNALPAEPDSTRDTRMRWFRESRLGMFVHYGPYAALAHGEWAMQQENLPRAEYDVLAAQLRTGPDAVRGWVELAVSAGCRYAVLTTKHCDGFHLWNTGQSEFNAVRLGPRRDLVAEFVSACRASGLRVGLYYGLMDWRHPDGDRCAIDEPARRRFVDYTHASVLELVSNYGPVDLLWFDGPWPLTTADLWESRRLVAEVRRRQPQIVINNRARLPEDYSTPEGSVNPAPLGRDWEACMTLNGDWGVSRTPPGDWRSVRDILRMLRNATAFGGNLLLNVGPDADGSVSPDARDRLTTVGQWLKRHGEAVYGPVDRLDDPVAPVEPWLNTGYWTRKGSTLYYWLLRGDPSPRFSIARVSGTVRAVTLVHSGRHLTFRQDASRLTIEGLPPLSDEPTASTPVLKVEFTDPPRQQLGAGMIDLPADKSGWW